MRPVLIDARAAARPELGGVERWARELAARLPRMHPGAYAVAAPPASLVHRAGHAWEQLALPIRAVLQRAPLLLCPANLAPLASRRNVVVIHDAVAVRHPEWYAPAYASWQRALMPRLAARAVHVVTVSEFSRDEIVSVLGADPARVSVVPGGVSEAFSPDSDPGAARATLGLERPYVLTLGSRTARKNLGALGPTARMLAARGIELVAAGGDRPQFRPEADPDGTRMLGRVDEDLLPGLYAGARAFVLPSRHEGFGLPCLEAMAAGVPVTASRRGGVPEACGDAAVLFDPDRPDEIAGAVEWVLGDDAARARLRARGLERAARFTWKLTAEGVHTALAGINPDTLAARGTSLP